MKKTLTMTLTIVGIVLTIGAVAAQQPPPTSTTTPPTVEKPVDKAASVLHFVVADDRARSLSEDGNCGPASADWHHDDTDVAHDTAADPADGVGQHADRVGFPDHVRPGARRYDRRHSDRIARTARSARRARAQGRRPVIPAPVKLVLPASPRGRRRSFGLAASLGAHAVLLLLILLLGRPSAPPVLPRVTPSAEKLVWVTPVPAVPPVTPAPPTPPTPKTKPVTYAAAPTSITPARDWREMLPRALALQADGINAPSFVIDNLDPVIITTLVGRHLALLVAGRPPFDRDARQVLWAGANPTETAPLPSGWTQRVARRVVVLPREWTRGISLAADEQVYLMITTDLDAAILAAQLAVAEQRGLALKTLTRTHGRLLPAADGLLDFRIDSVETNSARAGGSKQ